MQAVKVSVAQQHQESAHAPVHINFHVHLNGNKPAAPNVNTHQQQQLQCSGGGGGKGRTGLPGVDYDATPLPAHELQKWIADLEKMIVSENVEIEVPHTILLATQDVTVDGISVLPGCTDGRGGDPLGGGKEEGELLGLCGAKLPELGGLGANNEIPITQIRIYAKILHKEDMVPFPSGDPDQDYLLGYCIVMLNTGREHMAVDILTTVIGRDPKFVGAYHARAVAYARMGLQHPVNAALAIQDFSKAIELDPKNPVSWEKRAEIFTTQGRNREAYTDISKALELRPTAKLFKYRGYMMFKEEKYVAAMKDLMESVKRDNNQVDVMHLLGLSLYHQGKIHEAIRIYKKALELKSDYVDLLRSMAHAYRELGEYREALDCFNKALHIDPEHIPSFQLRGSLLYHAGKPKEALGDYKMCLGLDPGNEVCRYMKGLCLVAMGQYYEAVKTVTQLMVQTHVSMGWLEYEKVKYIRELSRYLHAHLDTPFNEYSMDQDLDSNLKDRWVKNLPFQSEGYREMAGLSPDISDVDLLEYMDLPQSVHSLVCRAISVGRLTQYSADGFLPSERTHLALGLGSLEVAQTIQQYWEHGRNFRNGNGKRFGWRDVMDIAVKWRRYIDPDQPVLWLDHMPSVSFHTGYSSHMNLIQGQHHNIRYSSYFETVFNLTKRMVQQHGAALRDRSEERLLANLDKVTSCEGLLFLVNQLKVTNDRSAGFMVSTRLDSFKDRSANLEGAVFSLSGELATNIMFSIDTLTTKYRSEQYHTEIHHIWGLLSDEMHSRKAAGSVKDMDHDSVVNLILSMIYYFYNLMPLSRGSSSVAYTMALGLIMALGREVTGRIPKDKLVDLEAILCGSPQTFASWARSWMNIKKSSFNLGDLALVSETFPTLRTILETLNVGADFCESGGL
ncbi:tetratricopeptide repeat protein 13-like [Diadema antillarum]|uniref:tetratricopeptide repeat protein 13-like n=1 Tax=Diadema antillarum TaxID=105358 RepID=UPI003A83F0F9